jgi:hypothetical protein
LIDTIDDSFYGVIIFIILLIEIIILMIIPWFFNWKVGLIILSYICISMFFFFILLEDDKKSNWKTVIFIILIQPYLLLALFPIIVVNRVRDKIEHKLSIIELRRKKLKYLRKKIRINKLKFWKK